MFLSLARRDYSRAPHRRDEERTDSCLFHSSVNEQNNRFSTLFSSSCRPAARFNRTEEKRLYTAFELTLKVHFTLHYGYENMAGLLHVFNSRSCEWQKYSPYASCFNSSKEKNLFYHVFRNIMYCI